MSRLYRSWACPCCGSEWPRIKADIWHPDCHVCGRETVAARVPRASHQCAHRRAATALHRAQERIGALPRTRSGRALRPSPVVRLAWRQVRLARTRPAMVRHGYAFLTLLLSETRDNFGPDGHTVVRWSMTPRISHGRFGYTKHAGGMTGVPKVQLATVSQIGLSTLGDFRRDLRRGIYEIRIQNGRDLDDMRHTLAHEILHVLDSEAGIGTGHDRLWDKRLARMGQMFPSKGL